MSPTVKYKSTRAAITPGIPDPFVRRLETHLALREPFDTSICRLEAEIEHAARQHYPTELAVLQTTPGVDAGRSLTILLEIDTIDRYDTHSSSALTRGCAAPSRSPPASVSVRATARPATPG